MQGNIRLHLILAHFPLVASGQIYDSARVSVSNFLWANSRFANVEARAKKTCHENNPVYRNILCKIIMEYLVLSFKPRILDEGRIYNFMYA